MNIDEKTSYLGDFYFKPIKDEFGRGMIRIYKWKFCFSCNKEHYITDKVDFINYTNPFLFTSNINRWK